MNDRLRSGIAALLLTFGLAAGAAEKPKIVASTTQIADIARQIAGDRCEVFCLLGPGVNPHGYVGRL